VSRRPRDLSCDSSSGPAWKWRAEHVAAPSAVRADGGASTADEGRDRTNQSAGLRATSATRASEGRRRTNPRETSRPSTRSCASGLPANTSAAVPSPILPVADQGAPSTPCSRWPDASRTRAALHGRAARSRRTPSSRIARNGRRYSSWHAVTTRRRDGLGSGPEAFGTSAFRIVCIVVGFRVVLPGCSRAAGSRADTRRDGATSHLPRRPGARSRQCERCVTRPPSATAPWGRTASSTAIRIVESRRLHEVDVEEDAVRGGLALRLEEGFGGAERPRLEAAGPEKPRRGPAVGRVVVDDRDARRARAHRGAALRPRMSHRPGETATALSGGGPPAGRAPGGDLHPGPIGPARRRSRAPASARGSSCAASRSAR
jgi:hypothetical protein